MIIVVGGFYKTRDDKIARVEGLYLNEKDPDDKFFLGKLLLEGKWVSIRWKFTGHHSLDDEKYDLVKKIDNIIEEILVTITKIPPIFRLAETDLRNLSTRMSKLESNQMLLVSNTESHQKRPLWQRILGRV